MDQQEVRAAERPTESDDRRRTLWKRLGVAGAVVVAAAALVAAVPAMRSLFPERVEGGQAYPTQNAPHGVSATSSETAAVSDPFAGTAAENYAKGAAGITLPAAKAVRDFTAAEVGNALKKVRAALIASRLDHQMIIHREPKKFLAMLAPVNRKDLGTWFKDGEFSTVATWIDPGVKLDLNEEPRVSGRITYSSLMVEGVPTLRVTTNFVWVYAFDSPLKPIALVHDENVWEFTDPDDMDPEYRGMWLAETDGYMAWMDCDSAQRSLLRPEVPGEAGPQDLASSVDPDDWLRPDYSLDVADDTC